LTTTVLVRRFKQGVAEWFRLQLKEKPGKGWLSTPWTGGTSARQVLYACRHGRSRLRRCAAAGCGRWLADTSRNQSRRYCEHACASRTTVAAHRARKAAKP
jgi:predicted RNA-binding Zn ribbon-like protein